MATVTKVNGDLIVKSTVFKTAQVSAWRIVLAAALTDDSQAGGTGTAITEGTARKVAQELGSTAMMFEVSSTGKDFILVGDSHALDAAIIERRVEEVLGSSSAVASVTELSSFEGITATA